MEDIKKNNVKVLGIILIILSVLGVISAFFDLNRFNAMLDLFNKFGIDTASYATSQTFLIFSKFLIAISIIVFSFLLIKIKNVGRIGSIFSLIALIFYILIAPLVPGDESLRPNSIPDDNSISSAALLYAYIFYLAICIGLIFIIIYLNKKETKQIFQITT